MVYPGCLKCWICFSFLSVVFFFILQLLTFETNETITEHHLEPLFYINDTLSAIHVKLDSNFSMWLPSEKKNRTSRAFLTSYNETSSRKEFRNCSETPIEFYGKLDLIEEAAPSFQTLLNEFRQSDLQEDGHYQPSDCISRCQIAIIIPYRDRFEHLNIFLRNMHPFLQKQKLDYTIFVVEQAGDSPFNRGMLMNIGFVEAMKIRPFDCFIFHDVDLLPEDDRNFYNCSEQPRHLSVAVNVFNYELPYVDIFGGVCAMSAEHFQLVNGFSNMFWGWGGEDDDMSMRIKMKGLHVLRYPFSVARYTMLTHKKAEINPQRFEKLNSGRRRFKTEGLNSLEYQRIALRSCKLFTWILVKLTAPTKHESFLNALKSLYFTG